MRTRLGRMILKKHSKRMGDLNMEMVELAKRFRALPARLGTSGEIELQHIMDLAEYNRIEHNDLQQEINKVIRLEGYLDYEEEK